MGTELPTTDRCLNCGRSLDDRFCPSCGQRNVDYRTSLLVLLREVIQETFEIDSRFGRTVVPFLFKPGTLTREYNAGRRSRYTPPFRLYIFASLFCFLVLGIRNQITPMDFEVHLGDASAQTVSDAKDLEGELSVALRDEGMSEQDAADVLDKVSKVRKATQRKDEPSRVNVKIEEIPDSWQESAFGRAMQGRIERFEALPVSDQVDVIRDGALAHAPTAVFLLLPIYALLIKIAFLGSGRYYVEHLIFALHLHAFAFLVIALVAAVRFEPFDVVLATIPLYFFVALKRAYAIGWLGALFRGVMVAVGYLVLLVLGTAAVVVAAVVL